MTSVWITLPNHPPPERVYGVNSPQAVAQESCSRTPETLSHGKEERGSRQEAMV